MEGEGGEGEGRGGAPGQEGGQRGWAGGERRQGTLRGGGEGTFVVSGW